MSYFVFIHRILLSASWRIWKCPCCLRRLECVYIEGYGQNQKGEWLSSVICWWDRKLSSICFAFLVAIMININGFLPGVLYLWNYYPVAKAVVNTLSVKLLWHAHVCPLFCFGTNKSFVFCRGAFIISLSELPVNRKTSVIWQPCQTLYAV